MNIMSNNGIQAFKGCYMMQPEDIAHFADTLSDGFGMYGLFRFICNGDYSHRKMQMFWAVTIAKMQILSSYICPRGARSRQLQII